MKKIFIIAVTLVLAACDKSDVEPARSSVAASITATIGESVTSRASGTEWAENDKIGITATTGMAKPYVNIEYTTAEGDGKFTGKTIYIYNPMSLTAYYPYRGSESNASGIITDITTTAEKQTADKQAEFDFLYAHKENITVNDPSVEFQFAHKMSKITLIFKKGDGAVSRITSYTIKGLVLDGTFNTETGVCAANTEAEAADSKAETKTITMTTTKVESGEDVSSLIVFPQNTKTVNLTINDDEKQQYACTLNFGDQGLKSGNNYRFTINVSKDRLSVNSSITEWNPINLNSEAKSED